MANPSLVVRIAANLQELRANLAEGKNQIETTTAAMQKLSTSFQGDRLIQNAHNVAAAVQNIGGVANLTEREQARVNRTVSEALAKYDALGKEAPEALRKLAADTAHATEKTSTLATAARNLFALFSARAILRAASDAIAYGGHISDLASKAGMTAEAFQRMGFAAGQSGVPVERMADGAVQLSKRLIEGDTSAVAAVKALGLNMTALVASGPERALYAIGDAIATVPNAMEQAAIATNLFGRTGADFLPAFKGHMQEVADASERAGLILREDTVNALDRADDSFARVRVSMTVMIGQALEPMLPAIEQLALWVGTNLPAALQFARDAFDGLILVGMRFRAWLLETAVAIAQAVADVPVLGRVFGESAGDIAEMSRRAQEARDAVSSFVAMGARPAKDATEAATPALRGFGQALHETRGHAETAKRSIEEFIGPLEEFGGMAHRSIAETAKLTAQLEAWARVNSATLAPSIRQVNAALGEQNPLVNSMTSIWAQFAPTVQQNTSQAQTGISGFFGKVFGGAEGLGQSVSSIFQAAFTGGGGAVGAVKAFATQAVSAMLSLIPGVGPFVAAFAGPIVEMFSKLGKKAADFFRSLFGGPSRDELNGRKLVEEFEGNLANLLNAQQKAEAGNDSWKQTVIAIRDAYIAAGLTEEEALRDAERLWASSRDGAQASQRVIEEIEAKMHATGTAAAEAVDKVGAALNNLPREVNIDIRGNYHTYGEAPGPGYASGTMGVHGSFFRDFGSATPAVLHGHEAVITPQQAPAFARAVLGGDADVAALLRDMPRLMKIAMREAMAGA